MISLFKILNELKINKPGINYQKEWDRIKKEIMDEYGYNEGHFDEIDDEAEGYDELTEDEINRMVDKEFEKKYPGVDIHDFLNELEINKPNNITERFVIEYFQENIQGKIGDNKNIRDKWNNIFILNGISIIDIHDFIFRDYNGNNQNFTQKELYKIYKDFAKFYKENIENKQIQEDNVTGGTATFNAGYGENYATPFSFGKKRKSKKNKFKSKTFDVISWKEGLNELEINNPSNKEIVIGFIENSENYGGNPDDGYTFAYIHEDLVLKHLLKKFPNDKTYIINWVEELNDFGVEEEEIITTKKDLENDFKEWLKNNGLNELEINNPGIWGKFRKQAEELIPDDEAIIDVGEYDIQKWIDHGGYFNGNNYYTIYEKEPEDSWDEDPIYKSDSIDKIINWLKGKKAKPLLELEINKPGGKKISLQSFKENMKNWFKTNYGGEVDIDFEGLNKEIDSLKTKKELIDFMRGEDLIGDDWPSLLDFIIDNTINI